MNVKHINIEFIEASLEECHILEVILKTRYNMKLSIGTDGAYVRLNSVDDKAKLDEAINDTKTFLELRTLLKQSGIVEVTDHGFSSNRLQ